MHVNLCLQSMARKWHPFFQSLSPLPRGLKFPKNTCDAAESHIIYHKVLAFYKCVVGHCLTNHFYKVVFSVTAHYVCLMFSFHFSSLVMLQFGEAPQQQPASASVPPCCWTSEKQPLLHCLG